MIKQQRHGGMGACLATALAVAVPACTTYTRNQEPPPPPAHAGSTGLSTNAIVYTSPAYAGDRPAQWMGGRISPINDNAAPDSVEGRLRSEGESWQRTPGPVKAGTYVQDILQGRLDQPDGRGAIGKVVSVDEFIGMEHAWVDFGRGCVEHIRTSELSPVRIVEPAIPILR